MRPAIPVALLLVLAGCSAPVTGPTDTPTPEPTPTLSTPTDATAANTVAYGNLSVEAKAALDGTARFAPDSPYIEGESFDVEAAEVFGDHAFIRQGDTFYAVTLQHDGYVASYHIQAAQATVSEDASVVAVENVSADVQDEVRSAIENGSHSVPPGKWSSQPAALEDLQFVRYEGETYHVSVLHGDHPTFELTVTPVE